MVNNQKVQRRRKYITERGRLTKIVGEYIIERSLSYSTGIMICYDAGGAAWKVSSGRPVKQSYWRITKNGKWINSFLTLSHALKWAKMKQGVVHA